LLSGLIEKTRYEHQGIPRDRDSAERDDGSQDLLGALPSHEKASDESMRAALTMARQRLVRIDALPGHGMRISAAGRLAKL
jgi:hypothetical protein